MGVLFKLNATALAIFLSLNSIHPSVKSFLPLPPCFFLFFLTAASVKANYKSKYISPRGGGGGAWANVGHLIFLKNL